MRNKIIAIVAILVLVAICYAADQVRSESHTVQNRWVVVDTTTTAGDEPNDLAVDERTYLTVLAATEGGDDEISTYPISTAMNAGRFRCIGYSEQNVTHQIYLGTLGGGTNCELVKAGQLAWAVGTQVSTTTGYEMADAVTVTSYCWTKSWSSATPGSELVAEATIDLMGADILVVVPTVSDCNSRLLFKGF